MGYRRARWSTGWVVLPGTRCTPGAHLHRPHPDRPQATVCDRVIGGRQVTPLAPPGVPYCPRCEATVGRQRRRERAAAQREQERARKDPARQKVDDTDAYDRAKQASVSIRTASGGLPGLGRRR